MPDIADLDLRRGRWMSGWRRLVFPSIFLLYLGRVVQGIQDHARGAAAATGYAVLIAFAVCYIGALHNVFGGVRRPFWRWFAAMGALFLAELPIAHQDASVMTTFVLILSIAALRRRSVPVVAALIAVTLFVPALVPSWKSGLDTEGAFSTALNAIAMYFFFEIIRANRALVEARAEVSRLATEAERARIARDLHDLLGHSLTTITVKSELARRLATVDPARAAVEIGEVEQLSRQSLADVRAAVANYRDVTLTNELASGGELLRAAGIHAELPGSTDAVRGDLHELFGWVVREGVTNVVRHSRARTCSITLRPDAVEIADDGIGTSAADGTGLQGVRERVEAAGGTMEVGPRGFGGSGGWRLRVTVPAQ